MASPRQSLDANGLHRIVSHGRGGAGNIGEPNPNPQDIDTIPTIKSQVYTTGRGGTGNMAINDPAHPDLARKAQDLEINPPRNSTSEIHGGRGGAGNVIKTKEEEELLRQEEEEKRRLAEGKAKKEPVDHSKIDYRGWADRGKDLLFGRKKKAEGSQAS